MSEWRSPSGEPYGGPPETGPPSLPYPPYGPPPGYPTAGYPSGYPAPDGYPALYPGFAPDQRDVRPGVTMGSAVLAFVNAGLLILAGGLLVVGASILSDFEDATNSHTNYGLEIALDGAANFVAAALLISGGVMITGRRSTGRTLLTVGNGVVVAMAIYWLVRFHVVAQSGFIFYTLLFAALAIVSTTLSWLTAVTAWLRPAR